MELGDVGVWCDEGEKAYVSIDGFYALNKTKDSQKRYSAVDGYMTKRGIPPAEYKVSSASFVTKISAHLTWYIAFLVSQDLPGGFLNFKTEMVL